jgi:hypothetical protein
MKHKYPGLLDDVVRRPWHDADPFILLDWLEHYFRDGALAVSKKDK